MTILRAAQIYSACILFFLLAIPHAHGVTLEEIRTRGTLRHLAVPYARFANRNGEGLDCALLKRFADYLQVSYELIPTDFHKGFLDLTGTDIDDPTHPQSPSKIIGDIFASGVTVLPERYQYVDFSLPTFSSQVWLMAKTDSELTPIRPSGDAARDIALTLRQLSQQTIFGVSGTSLDIKNFPILTSVDVTLHNLIYTKKTSTFQFALQRQILFLAESPNILVGLNQWPFRFKVIGPISPPMDMAVAFDKNSSELREAFNQFFKDLWESGEYKKMVEHYYPGAFFYLASFLKKSTP
ncbi:MAG: transporter substrate-binding domain-containing protein [Desulfovibrionales bacterium]|nr:transporter substrate-binding domain-containing protein [Desulfovibrionales bacterium]